VRPGLATAFHVEEGNLGIYLRDISRYKPLSSREEFEAAVRIRSGDRRSLEKLVKTNLRFVVSVARNYQHQGMSLADLINEGNIGLIKAARRFDEKKNFKFISYAVWWIRQSILQSLANHSRILRVPVNRVAIIHRVGRTQARLEQRYQRPAMVDEVAAELGISIEDVAHSIRIGANHRSLDAPIGHDSGGTLIDFIDDHRQERPDDFLADSPREDNVDRILDLLSSREQNVLRLYFGIGHETNHTLDEIAQQFCITRERVRQIKETALGRLKRLKAVSRISYTAV
jgi:RNA polymerase primary sigma factor